MFLWMPRNQGPRTAFESWCKIISFSTKNPLSDCGCKIASLPPSPGPQGPGCGEERQHRTTDALHPGPYLLGVTGDSDEDMVACPGRVPKHCFLVNGDPRNLCFPTDADLGLSQPLSLHHNGIPGLYQPPNQPPIYNLQI